MTTPDETTVGAPSKPSRAAVLIELAGLVLVVGGVSGLAVAAYVLRPLYALVLLSVLAVAGGWALMTSEE